MAPLWLPFGTLFGALGHVFSLFPQPAEKLCSQRGFLRSAGPRSPSEVVKIRFSGVDPLFGLNKSPKGHLVGSFGELLGYTVFAPVCVVLLPGRYRRGA